MNDGHDMPRHRFRLALLLLLAAAALMRGLFPAADPPWNPSIGIVWHDEGAWVHNARNEALFGEWALDRWNPMYIAPVFTGLEYVAFRAFGVGVRQARLMPELLGLLSVWLIGLGCARLAGYRAGLIAAALLGTNYFYVMWNRTALMEGPMVGFMVCAWYCHTRVGTNPRWGIGTAAFAMLAFFTKAVAAFFIAAVVIEAGITFWFSRGDAHPAGQRGASWTLTSLAVCGAAALALFVIPHWTDYRFYNWQMSVTRKPAYDFKSLLDRATWFPLQDMFTRMWFVVVVGVTCAAGMLARVRRAEPGERLLLLWLALGAAEVILHDAGNERRFVFFVPPLTALTSLALGRLQLVPEALERVSKRAALAAAPFVAYASYVVFAALVRLAFLRDIRPNVRIGSALAVAFCALVYATWPRMPRFLATHLPGPAVAAVAMIVSTAQVEPYVQWASGRTYKNYEASRELGRILPPGTLVHGKLANGLSLENRIQPVFVGRGFGNYEDRKTRDDVRYILTYIAPSLGYESQARNPVIQDVIDAYPEHRIMATFDVAETATGHDRAALIDKFGGRQDLPQRRRAKD